MVAAPISSALSIIFNNTNWLLAQLVLGIVHLFAQLPTDTSTRNVRNGRSARASKLLCSILVQAVRRMFARGEVDWLFDVGAERDFERVVREYLRMRGINRLDGLLLSHGDAGHLGGASALIHDFHPRYIIDSAARDRSPLHRALVAELQSRKIERSPLAAQDTVPLSRTVAARALFPPKGFQAKIADDQAFGCAIVRRQSTACSFRFGQRERDGRKTFAKRRQPARRRACQRSASFRHLWFSGIYRGGRSAGDNCHFAELSEQRKDHR